MQESISTLSYAVRPGVIVKYSGQLLFLFALLSLAPLAVAFGFGEYATAWRFAVTTGLMLALSLPTQLLGTPRQIHPNESLVIAALIFIMVAGFMVYPMRDSEMDLLDVMFEAISGITTTGLTTLTSVHDKSHAFLFTRAWLQWCGGLGIVVLSVALLAGQQTSARRLLESIGGENLETTARTYARRMLGVYLALSVTGFFVLWFFMQDAFIALTHALAAISTGGFSSFDQSLADVAGTPGPFVIIGLGLLGAFPLPLFYFMFRRHWRETFGDLELRALLVTVMLVIGLLYLSLSQLTQVEGALTHAVLLGLSAQSTTGFTSLDIKSLDDLSKLILILAMFVGGGMASTAGGIKILRLLIILRLVHYIIQRTAMPAHAFSPLKLGGRRLASDELEKVGVVIALFVMTIILSWLPFIAYGYAPLDALFEVVSATGTVGLSSGISRTELEPLLKLLLCIDMLAGRVEIIALVVLCYPGTWFGRRMEN